MCGVKVSGLRVWGFWGLGFRLHCLGSLRSEHKPGKDPKANCQMPRRDKSWTGALTMKKVDVLADYTLNVSGGVARFP